jgi:hypothetical protein
MNRQPHVDETRRNAIATLLFAAVATAMLGAAADSEIAPTGPAPVSPREFAPGERLYRLPAVRIVAGRDDESSDTHARG